MEMKVSETPFLRNGALWRDSLVRNTLYLFVGNALPALGGLVYWYVADRMFSQEIVGIGSTAASIVIFLASIGQVGFGYGLIRFLPLFGANRKRAVVWSFVGAAAIAVMSSILLGISWSFVVPSLAPLLGSRVGVVTVVGSAGVLAVVMLYDNLLVAVSLAPLVPIKAAISVVARVALISLLPGPPLVRILASVSLSGLIGLLITQLLSGAWRGDGPSSGLESSGTAVGHWKMITYSIWNSVTGLSGIAPSMFLPLLLINVVGPARTAAFYISWTLLGGLLMVPSALSISLLSDGVGTNGATRPFTLRQGALIVGTILGFLPLASMALWAMGRDYIAEGLPTLLLLCAGVYPFTAGIFATTRIRLRGSQQTLAMLMVTCTIASLLGAWLLSQRFGAPGAAFAWSTAQALYALLATKVANKLR